MITKVLYDIFERNLLRISNENPSLREFTTQVVEDFLQDHQVQSQTLLLQLKDDLIEELEIMVREMTLKKIYGSTSIAEYRKRKLSPNNKSVLSSD